MKKIPVAHIDDHLIFRQGVKEIIEKSSDFTMMISVGEEVELFEQLANTPVDILLLDIRLSNGSNGQDILLRVKSEYPDMKVIMFTMHDEAIYINATVKNGASGYLLKTARPDEVIETLKNVARDGAHFDANATSILIRNIQNENSGEFPSLNKLEVTIIKYISEGFTAEEIGKKLYKSNRTIEGYRQKILNKTQTKNTAELITWAYRNGVII